MQDHSTEELDALLRAAPMPSVPPEMERRLTARIAEAKRHSAQQPFQNDSSNWDTPRPEDHRFMASRNTPRELMPGRAVIGTVAVLIVLLTLFVFHLAPHHTVGTQIGPSNTPAPTLTSVTSALDATYKSADGLYTFQYNQEHWTPTPVTDTDFPQGYGIGSPAGVHTLLAFYALPATKVIPRSDYPKIMTDFWKTITVGGTITNIDIGAFTSQPDVTLGANTWSVGSGDNVDAMDPYDTFTYYALVHDGKTFFITTSGVGSYHTSTYLQPMLASFKFLK